MFSGIRIKDSFPVWLLTCAFHRSSVYSCLYFSQTEKMSLMQVAIKHVRQRRVVRTTMVSVFSYSSRYLYYFRPSQASSIRHVFPPCMNQTGLTVVCEIVRKYGRIL